MKRTVVIAAVLAACGGAQSAPPRDPATRPLPAAECEHVIGHFINVSIRSASASTPAKTAAHRDRHIEAVRDQLTQVCRAGGLPAGVADCYLEAMDRDELDHCTRGFRSTARPTPR